MLEVQCHSFRSGTALTRSHRWEGKTWRTWTHTAQALGAGGATHNKEACSRGQLGSHTNPGPKPTERALQINLLPPVSFLTELCSSSVYGLRRLTCVSPIWFFLIVYSKCPRAILQWWFWHWVLYLREILSPCFSNAFLLIAWNIVKHSVYTGAIIRSNKVECKKETGTVGRKRWLLSRH